MSPLVSQPTLKLLTGVTMGSSFIGMVHILKKESSSSNQGIATIARKASGEFKKGLFFSSKSGGFGVDQSSSASIKNLFSSSDITSHITLITTGVIPTIQASDGLKTVLKQMNSAETMDTMLKLQNANSGEGGSMDSMESAGEAAMNGQRVQALASKNTESAITAVTTMEGQQDKVRLHCLSHLRQPCHVASLHIFLPCCCAALSHTGLRNTRSLCFFYACPVRANSLARASRCSTSAR